MKDCHIIRYGEISIKGLNRKEFERLLVGNIKDCLNKNNVKDYKIAFTRNRIIVYGSEDLGCLRRVFGIDSMSKAIETELSMSAIKKVIDGMLNIFNNKSFKVAAKRLDKGFEFNSHQINEELGAYVLDKVNCRVDVKNPKVMLFVEVGRRTAHIFTEKIKCVGGLPVGIEGDVYVLIENNGGLLAALLAMKRGCSIKPISFGGFDISLLEKYAYGQDLGLELIKDIKDLKADNVKALFTSDRMQGILAVPESDVSVTRGISDSESPRSFASVTDKIEDLKTYETKLTVLRPLIGMDDKQINEKLIYYESLYR